ncbi:MAG: sigma-70 family RNA polymerase sigma factor [Selenomonadaceae bacterium]|nr:sigma-70 family RNA polymerase sigma factor [Selenomonadaceae bacterium]
MGLIPADLYFFYKLEFFISLNLTMEVVVMDEDYIFKLAARYAKHGLMSYEDFENVFEDFERREQYEICEILYESGIELVDEVPREIFSEEIKPSVYEESPLPVKKSVAMSNEMLVKSIQDTADYETRMQALQDLCQKNIAFVYNFAKKYENFLGNYLELEELVQEGFIGMLRAVETFDRRKGYKFLTYAGDYIKSHIRRAIMDIGFRVRVPVHMQENIAKVMSLDAKFYMEGDEDFQLKISQGIDFSRERNCYALPSVI